MNKVGRNDPCPCGSGKKFKRCHLGREQELPQAVEDTAIEPGDLGSGIVSLPEVDYGGCRDMADALDLEALTGKKTGVRFVDLRRYRALLPYGVGGGKGSEDRAGSVLINVHKTEEADPENVYIAVSKGVDESTLAHQLAHVLDYLAGSGLMPGTLDALAGECDVPVEHLEHTMDFGERLCYLRDRFQVRLDADDTIIAFLYDNEMLLPSDAVRAGDRRANKEGSRGMLEFLSRNGPRVEELIRELPGFIGDGRARGG